MTKALIVVGVMFTMGIAVGGCMIGTRNEMVRQENGLTAQYKQNQNSFAEMTNKVREVAQVPEMYTADLEKVTKAAIAGRYGAGGSKAVFQFIQEQNPQVDPALYTRLEQVIEASRVKFSDEQKLLLDKKRVYLNQLETFPENTVASLFGFPRVDLAQYDIVTSDETERAFETKKAGPLKLRE
jgi:hypothetical protein